MLFRRWSETSLALSFGLSTGQAISVTFSWNVTDFLNFFLAGDTSTAYFFSFLGTNVLFRLSAGTEEDPANALSDYSDWPY